MKNSKVTVILHCKNEALNIKYSLDSIVQFFENIFVVDAGSTDATLDVLEIYRNLIQVFHITGTRENLVQQRNWALKELPIKTEWVYIHDADELFPLDLHLEIMELLSTDNKGFDAYWVKYKEVFFDKPLFRSILWPNYSCRLLRYGKCSYENRTVNAHVTYSGKEGYLKSFFIHHDRRGIVGYINRLASLSILEASSLDEINERKFSWRGLIRPIGRRFLMKKLFYKLPFRWLWVFIYFFIIRRGFLEGRQGFYAVILRVMHEWTIEMVNYQQILEKKNK